METPSAGPRPWRGSKSRVWPSRVWPRHRSADAPRRGEQSPRSARRSGFLGSLGAVVLAVVSLVGLTVTLGLDDPGSGFDGCPAYAPLDPTGNGVARTVTDQSELSAAMAAAGPGDTINLATGQYREIHYRDAYGHRNGTASAPIVIQAAAGATPVVDFQQPDDPQLKPVVDIVRRAHIRVRGLTVRNRTFGLRASGSTDITFEHNDVSDTGHSGVVAQVFNSDPSMPSTGVTIRCNRIHDTGRVAPEFGEGIYIGTGSTSVADPTSNVVIEGNDIYRTGNEGIDVKHHVTDVAIRSNLIHDLTPYYGGAISLGLNNLSWGPANYLVEDNRIWNISSGMYYAQAIAVAHGPTVIRNNVIWGITSATTSDWPWIHPIQIHGDDNTAAWAYGFGNPSANQVEIADNTVLGCQVSCIDSFTDPGAVAPDLTMGVNVVDLASSGDAAGDSDLVVAADAFVGPTEGDADAGSGPGSGLVLISSTTTTTTTVPTTASSTTASSTTGPSTTTPSTTASSTTASSTTVSSSTVSSTTAPSSSTTASTTAPETTTTTAATSTAPTTTSSTTIESTTTTGSSSTSQPATTAPTSTAGSSVSSSTSTVSEPSTTTEQPSPDGATTTTQPVVTVPETTVTTVRPDSTVPAKAKPPGRRLGWYRNRSSGSY